MQVRILGCSGGIGGGRQTTSLLVDQDVLIDAGSGVSTLSLEELGRIRHVFITHTHLDHILSLPLLLDTIADELDESLVLHALPEVIATLKQDLFNWRLWPDFTVIPSPDKPFLVFEPIQVGETVILDGRQFSAVPANHGMPAVGYLLKGKSSGLLFSGDTASHPDFWALANATENLGHLIVEASFPNDQRQLAEVSNHYCPATLAPDLAGVKADMRVWITHLKPGREDGIMEELKASVAALGSNLSIRPLTSGQVIDL